MVKGQVKTSTFTSVVKQVVKSKIDGYLKDHFLNTLGTIPDINRLFMSLVHHESSFNPRATSPDLDGNRIDHLKVFLRDCSAAKSKYGSCTAEERAQIAYAAKRCLGLTQCTGTYVLRGANDNLQKWRPDLAGPLMIDMGQDVRTILHGDTEEAIGRQVLAGLIVLETKFKDSQRLVSKGRFADRTTATFGAYLGLGGKDANGSIASSYANKIMYGSAYTIANNGLAPSGTPLIASSGSASVNPASSPNASPTVTAASGQRLGPAGCA